MRKNFFIVAIVLLAGLAAGCNRNDATTANANLNSNVAADAPATRPAPDNSEIATSVDASGVKTETRTFRDNPRIARVVVTTRNGVKTGKAISPKGEERDLDQNEVEEALEATGDKVADAAEFVAGATGDVGREAADKAEDVKDETGDVAREAADKAEDVKDQTVKGSKKVARGAKTVAEKTVSGTKKAVKKVIP